MSIITSPLLLGADGVTQYQISRSLRFNSGDSAYLNRTPASAGNRKTWTWAGWVKRSAIGSGNRTLFDATLSGGGTENPLIFGESADDTLSLYLYNGSSYVWQLRTAQVFRDPSSWYHIVTAVDTTQSTASDRVKIFINGTQVTTFAVSTYPSQNSDTYINNNTAHAIGSKGAGVSSLYSGYLADIHFIDGQALDPSSFTTTDLTTGQLIPKAYTGSYGTGTTVATATGALPIFNTTDDYGKVKGTGTRTDSNSSSIVLAVAMDGANNGTTFTDQSATIKGSGSAKTLTVNGNTKTSTVQSYFYGSSAAFDGSGDYLSATNADFAFGTGDFTVECWVRIAAAATEYNFVATRGAAASAAAWTFGVYTNSKLFFYTNGFVATGAASLNADTWYHVAVTRSASIVRLYLNGIVQDISSPNTQDFSTQTLAVGASSDGSQGNLNGYIQDVRMYKGLAKYTSNFLPVIPSNGFHLPFSDNSTTAALGTDTSTAGNNWTVNNFSVTAGSGNDSLTDTPTSYGTSTGVGGEVRGNYATLNALDTANTLSNGNLQLSNPSTGFKGTRNTVGMSSGKWYFETTFTAIPSPTNTAPALYKPNTTLNTGGGSYGNTYISIAEYPANTLNITLDGWSSTVYSQAGSLPAGTIVGIAFDADSGKIWFSVNGTWLNSGNPAAGTGAVYSSIPAGTYFFGGYAYSTSDQLDFNFGQRAFAYNSNRSGFKAVCDTNLPSPPVAKPDQFFETKLYTGNGGTQSIAGLAFSPDFVWIKNRSNALSHRWTDVLRGVEQEIGSDYTGAEYYQPGGLSSFNANGFTVGSNNGSNASGNTYVAWTWDGGTSTVTDNTGSIQSTRRTNQTAGFSIVSYTAPSSVSTVGHGLNVAPQFIISKNRTSSGNWAIYHASQGAGYYFEFSTQAAILSSGPYNSTAPTSSVFTIGTNSWWGSGNMISYCFTPVSGYSNFGSYVGNGSSDGSFVYTGFRPRWILIKASSFTQGWALFDTARSTYNASSMVFLQPNTSNSEFTTDIDILSNGFKARANDGNMNGSGQTYIYAAFAESPFQYARAR